MFFFEKTNISIQFLKLIRRDVNVRSGISGEGRRGSALSGTYWALSSSGMPRGEVRPTAQWSTHSLSTVLLRAITYLAWIVLQCTLLRRAERDARRRQRYEKRPILITFVTNIEFVTNECAYYRDNTYFFIFLKILCNFTVIEESLHFLIIMDLLIRNYLNATHYYYYWLIQTSYRIILLHFVCLYISINKIILTLRLSKYNGRIVLSI